MEKVLIFEEKNVIASIAKDYTQRAAKFTNCISLFNAIQAWEKVSTEERAKQVAIDPIEEFDKLLIANCGLKIPNIQPAKVAELIGIDRATFIENVKTCKLNPKHADFYLWNVDHFEPKESFIHAECERLRTYVESETEQTEYNAILSLVNALNKALELGFINTHNMNEIYRGCNFVDSRNSKFEVNARILAEKFKRDRQRAA